MKIALYTSNRTTIPPEKNIIAASAYLTGLLADGLMAKGHDVTLYAPKGSHSRARIIDLNMPSTNLDFAITREEWILNKSLGMKQIYLGELYKRAADYDIIHLQTAPVYLGMPFARLVSTPTVFTNHNAFVPQEKEILEYYNGLPIVTLSDHQRSVVPGLNYVKTIYNGIDVQKYPFQPATDQRYMYFLGRLVENKGIRTAIQAAQTTNKELVISGSGDKDYVRDTIESQLSSSIKYIGLIERESLPWFDKLAHAFVTLFPIQWEEPFGLVMIESMACGTPVIGYARGSVPEVIKDGETGFIVNYSDEDKRGDWIIKKTGKEGLAEAVNRLYSLPPDQYNNMRHACRRQVETNFSVSQMVENYEQVYQKIVSS